VIAAPASLRPATAARSLRGLVERHLALAGFAVFGLVAAAVRIADYNAPLDGDATQFLYVGDVIVHGGMPYVDAAYSKGPLTGLLFAVFEPIVGTSPAAVRLTVVPFAAAAAIALAGYVAHHAGRYAGALAGLTFAAFSAVADFRGAEAKTEQYGVAPVFGALWFATRRGVYGAVVAGVLLGCAVLINPALGVAIPAVAVELWFGTPRGGRARRLGVAAAGAAAPVVAACVWLAARGALDDMVKQVGGKVIESVRNHRGVGPSAAVTTLSPSRIVFHFNGLWAMSIVGCLVALRDARLRRAAFVLGLVMAAVVVRLKITHYELDYEYYTALPAMCGATALGIVALWRSQLVERIALAALVLAVPLWTLVIEPEWNLMREDPNARNPYGAAVLPVAAFVRAHTMPSDRIMVLGARAEVYWVAQRRAPTRFFDVFGVVGDSRYPAERQRDLARRPPAAIVVMNDGRLNEDRDLLHLVGSRRYVRAYSQGGSNVWLRPGVN
jgi:hypothetical protein